MRRGDPSNPEVEIVRGGAAEFGSLHEATIDRFREVLLEAAESVGVVQPPDLRPALRLWFLAMEERSRREEWRSSLGRPAVAVWQAAVAVLVEDERT